MFTTLFGLNFFILRINLLFYYYVFFKFKSWLYKLSSNDMKRRNFLVKNACSRAINFDLTVKKKEKLII